MCAIWNSNKWVNDTNEEELAKLVLSRMGEKIKSLRREKGWTQEFFAERASINDKEVSHIESGNRNITIETLVKIASALSITPQDLF